MRGTIHWVNAADCVSAEVRLYDNLFTVPEPESEEGEFTDYINPESLVVLKDCKLEKSLAEAKKTDRFQFMRQGYFCLDTVDSTPDKLVFNRSVSLKDSFKKGK